MSSTAVAEAVRARLQQLGLSQRELAARSGVSVATLRKLQSASAFTFRITTLARVSEALEWPPNTLARVAEGGRPPRGGGRQTPGGERAARVAALAVRLAPHELRGVERLIEELLKGPRPAPG